jgi:hypothetical protein
VKKPCDLGRRARHAQAKLRTIFGQKRALCLLAYAETIAGITIRHDYGVAMLTYNSMPHVQISKQTRENDREQPHDMARNPIFP